MDDHETGGESAHGAAVGGARFPGGVILSRAGDNGAVQWASPIADGTHNQSTSIALYTDRYMNWGLTREELQAGRSIMGRVSRPAR